VLLLPRARNFCFDSCTVKPAPQKLDLLLSRTRQRLLLLCDRCAPSCSLCRNIIHGSDGPETAVAEISLWFKPEELVKYNLDAHKWVYE